MRGDFCNADVPTPASPRFNEVAALERKPSSQAVVDLGWRTGEAGRQLTALDFNATRTALGQSPQQKSRYILHNAWHDSPPIPHQSTAYSTFPDLNVTICHISTQGSLQLISRRFIKQTSSGVCLRLFSYVSTYSTLEDLGYYEFQVLSLGRG